MGIAPGDEIRIRTHDGSIVPLMVRKITDDAVFGRSQRIPFNDIHMIEKNKQSESTMTLAGTVLIIVLIVAGSAALAYATHSLSSDVLGF